MKVPGVVKVIEIEGRPIPSEFQPLGGVAVVAQNTWAAIKGREALVVEWDAGVNGGYDSVAYRKQLEEAARKPGRWCATAAMPRRCSPRVGISSRPRYYLPHLAQAPMEPPVSTAWYKGRRLRGLGPDPGAASDPRAHRRAPETAVRQGHGQRDPCSAAVSA